MTANHVFYIPAMLLLGFFVGVMFGKRQAMAELAEREREERELAARRDRRAAGSDSGRSAPP